MRSPPAPQGGVCYIPFVVVIQGDKNYINTPPWGAWGAVKLHIFMEYLPQDPAILVSSINMLLRDEEFDTLESLCYSFSREPEEIKEYLIKNDYVYSEEQKQFRPVGYDE